ncbi:MAG: transcriptional repressor [Acidobacteria bacterium]|nr:transcriptional repressor [Acidobacteriota bacterium]
MPAIERFAKYLSENRLKMTRERRAILADVLSVRGHFDVDDLLARLRRSGHHVSRATLYRTLPRLVESGLIHKVEMVDGQARYELMIGRHHHDHMVCLRCGTILEFESPEVERIQEDVCRRKKFVMTGHTHQIRGYCVSCAGDDRARALDSRGSNVAGRSRAGAGGARAGGRTGP